MVFFYFFLSFLCINYHGQLSQSVMQGDLGFCSRNFVNFPSQQLIPPFLPLIWNTRPLSPFPGSPCWLDPSLQDKSLLLSGLLLSQLQLSFYVRFTMYLVYSIFVSILCIILNVYPHLFSQKSKNQKIIMSERYHAPQTISKNAERSLDGRWGYTRRIKACYAEGHTSALSRSLWVTEL